MSNKTVAILLVLAFVLAFTPSVAAEEFEPAQPEQTISVPPVPPETSEAPPDDTASATTTPDTQPATAVPAEKQVIAATQAVVRTGLFYGSNALASANLANEVGQGYLFGFYDKAGNFTVLGGTAEEKITVLKDTTMYTRDGVFYDSLPPSGYQTIGAWHLQADEIYSSFDDAAQAASLLDNGFPAYINGEYRVRSGAYLNKDSVEGSAAVGGSATCYTIVATKSGKILFEFDMGAGNYLGIMPTGAERPVTWFKLYKYNGGFEYKRMNGGDITVCNVALLGDYTRGVIPYEVGPSWHEESLKVAALCASSFAMYNRDRHKAAGFDVCNDIHCQVYHGLNRATDKTNAACDAVAGYAVYYDGKVCNTVYHSSNGGWTESAKNVWGGDYPYLQPVMDTFEDLTSASYGRWSTTYSGEEIAWILTQKGYSIGTVTKAYVSKYTDAGNVYEITFEDAKGNKRSFSMERARTILASDTYKKYTYSQRFNIISGDAVTLVAGLDNESVSAASATVIRADGTIETIANPSEVYVATASGVDVLRSSGGAGLFTFVGTGWGHNVGLSQWGAKGRAEAGWTYDKIIKYYYTGVEILKAQ